MKPISSWVITVVATSIGVATAGLVVLLWWAGTAGLQGEQLVTARFEALRTGLSIGIAGGGIFALYLAWRRQHSTEIGLQQKQQDQADVARAYALQERVAAETKAHQERIAEANEHDAAARRITELYSKSVEQIGSDKAPVRLGGLYALERLAQGNPSQRQTIINVICAYLRMPYTPPGEPTNDADEKGIINHRERVQEREVRLTAQRIISSHLRPKEKEISNDIFWSNIKIDLTAATLIDLEFSKCVVHEAAFKSATFVGHAYFESTIFREIAHFSDATFTHGSSFRDARFESLTNFRSCAFSFRTDFTSVQFHDTADFAFAKFAGVAEFSASKFIDSADFVHTTFKQAVTFSDSVFTGGPYSPGPDGPWPWTDFRDAQFELGAPKEIDRFRSKN
jgi:uncharacterized protein YjbI with pentapeptide repeats